MRRSLHLRFAVPAVGLALVAASIVATSGALPVSAAAGDPPVVDLIGNGDFNWAPITPPVWTCGSGVFIPPVPPHSEFVNVQPPDQDPGSPGPSTPPSPTPSGSGSPRPGQPVAVPAVAARPAVRPGVRPAAVASAEGGPGWLFINGTPTASSNAGCTQVVPVRPNSTYALAGWVRGGFAFLGTVEHGEVWSPGSTAYTELHTTFTTGPYERRVTVTIHGWYGHSGYAADDISLVGPDSNAVVPAPPAQVRAVDVTSRSVRLEWTGAPGASSYRVLRDGVRIAAVSDTHLWIGGLSPGERHTYTVVAVDTAGSSASSGPVTVATVAASSAPPQGLCAACGPFASIMEGTLSVSWSEVSGATDGYRIYLDGVRAGWLFRSRALVPGAARGPHQVQVSALNSAGESPLSTAVSVVVP